MAWMNGGRTRKPLGSGRWAGCEFLVLCEETQADIDKTLAFTDVTSIIPHAKAAELLWMYVDYTADATTTGNRLMRIRLIDSNSDVIGGFGHQQLSIAAGVNALVMLGKSLELAAVGASTPAHGACPDGFIFQKGQTINIAEFSIQEPLDDMIVHVMLAVYT